MWTWQGKTTSSDLREHFLTFYENPGGRRPLLTFIYSERRLYQQPVLTDPSVSSGNLKVDRVCAHAYLMWASTCVLFVVVVWRDWCAVHWLTRCKMRFIWVRHRGAMPSNAFCVRALVMVSQGQPGLGCIVRTFPGFMWLVISECWKVNCSTAVINYSNP